MRWLTEIRELVPCALIDGRGWDRLLQRAGDLPGASYCGFEFRLGAARPAADFFVVVVPGQALAEHYVRQAEAAPRGSSAAALARYLVQLRDPETAPRWVAGTMLEYEVAETAEERRAAPGVFLKVRLERELAHAHRRRWSPSELTATVARAVGWTENRGEQQAAARVFAALPAGSEVAHIGALPDRAPRAVRLVIQGVAHAEVTHLLERLGWSGCLHTARAVLADLRDLLPRFRLSVDVGAGARGVLPRLGLELYHAGEWGLEMDSWLTTGRGEWRPVVERLAARGWCLPAKAQGLLAWCALDRLYDRRGVHLLYRGINHVKLTIEEDNVVQAKAYAGVAFVRLADQRS